MTKQEWTHEQQRDRVRQRVRAAVDPDSYIYTPASDRNEYAKTDEIQRVGIYARVSTMNTEQTSSYELQQKYYEDLVRRYPKWELVKIYADEGKSGVTTQHREGFYEMMSDAYAGKLDLIIVKNISRLARNVIDFLSTVRNLAERKVGILFESEAIYSLNSNSHLALSFQATIAEEESRIRSRSMETSLRMRLDHGLPLTPELLGFRHDENGKLVINPETYKIPKLMFFMYLSGYSTQQIADTLTDLSKKTYLGNIKWTAGGVASTLQNERYCGDVVTRKRYKVFAADVVTQKTFKNRGEKPQSYYKDEHEAIVSRDDFIAVQHIMHNAKYGGTSLLPQLRVIPEGLLKGFVIVHPKWGSFKKEDYIRCCLSTDNDEPEGNTEFIEEDGSFDLRGYEVADYKLFDEKRIPAIMFNQGTIKFSHSCIRSMNCGNYIELLVHPVKKKIAIRPTTKDNKFALQWANGSENGRISRQIACKAYFDTLCQIFDWKNEYKYKLYGCIYRDRQESACIFSGTDASVYICRDELQISEGISVPGSLLGSTGKRIRAVVGSLESTFGNEYYLEKSANDGSNLPRQQWQTGLEGSLWHTGSEPKVTPYPELQKFIREELGDYFKEINNND